MNFNGVTVRQATSDDLTGIIHTFRESVLRAIDYTPRQREAWILTGSDPQKWHKRIRDQYFILTSAGSLISGFCSITTQGHIDVLYVHPDYWNSGIASQLIQEVLQYGKIHGCLCFTVDASLTAVPFFKRKGFTVVHRNDLSLNGVKLCNFKMNYMIELQVGNQPGR